MLISLEKAELVFGKVKQVTGEMASYCIAHDRMELSIEDLQWCIENMYGLKIEKLEVLFQADYLRGMVERYADRARILVRQDLTHEMKRFTATKELCHLMNDEKEDWSIAGTETLDKFLYPDPLTDMPDPQAQSEMLAEIAAIELLYPHGVRDGDRAKLKAKSTSLAKIALEHKVPPFIIGRALAKNHSDLSNECWGKLALAAE